jgi:ADP-ribose pyrophosphatase YjhB (NUDIX family)
MTEPQPIGTCALLLNSQGQVLLGKRKNSYKAGYYGLPGGRVEHNEPMLTAIEREVKEETGLDNLALKFVGVVRENQGAYDFVHFVYVAEIAAAVPELCEPEKCEGWEWFALGTEISDILPGHQAAIALWLSQEKLLDITS